MPITTLKNIIKKHERKISAGALLVGFLWDTITLTRIDYLFEVIVLGTHTSLIILWIIIINLVDGGPLNFQPFKFVRTIAPILMQVSFGALFSGLTVFYVKSASLSVTFIFVLLLAGLLIGNEFFRHRYQKLIFQLTILYVVLASFFALYLPVLVGSVGVLVFIGANVIALFAIFLLTMFLRLFLKERVEKSRNALRIILGSVFTGLLLLYFTNIIPPAPLALKEKGVYHELYRTGNAYIAEEEVSSWWRDLTQGEVITVSQGENIFVFSSVFAPTGLTTQIGHRWEYFDEQAHEWVSIGVISFGISGGRDQGFRGYTQKSITREGKWRVSVVTNRGQVLGRIGFAVVFSDEEVERKRVEL